jgi:tetratricopeptide (TPR) repeat protein
MTDPSSPSGAGAPSDEVEEVLRRAFLHAESGDWVEMADTLTQALEEIPDDPYLLCWLGMAEREMGLDGLAYERFKAALATGPTDPALLATAGNAVAAFDDPAAESALRTAALLAPDLPQARWSYGAYLSREGMIDQALIELAAAAHLSPEDPLIQVEKGIAHALGGALEPAEGCFERAVELDPEDGWALVLLGLTRLQAGELDDVSGPLEEGARLRAEDFDAQLLAALALTVAGWEERGVEMLERARIVGGDAEASLVERVQDSLDEGPEAAGRLLAEIGPRSFRERLMERP